MPHDELGATITLICILQLAINFYHRINHQPNAIWDQIGPRALEEIGISVDDEEDYFEVISRRFLETENAGN